MSGFFKNVPQREYRMGDRVRVLSDGSEYVDSVVAVQHYNTALLFYPGFYPGIHATVVAYALGGYVLRFDDGNIRVALGGQIERA